MGSSEPKPPGEQRPADSEADRGTADRALRVLTTEHYALQMIRGSTVFEASNRAGQYFSTLSAVLIALSLIAQVARTVVVLGLAVALLAASYVVGLITFWRALETSVEDVRCGVGIHRIRDFYRRVAPETSPYFVLSAAEDVETVVVEAGQSIWPGGSRPPLLPEFLSVAGLLNLVNGFVAGAALAALAVLADAGTIGAVAVGVAGGAFSIGFLYLQHDRAWRRGTAALDPEAAVTESHAEADRRS